MDIYERYAKKQNLVLLFVCIEHVMYLTQNATRGQKSSIFKLNLLSLKHYLECVLKKKCIAWNIGCHWFV